MKRIRMDNRGALIVEASFVFPICLIIVLMLLYLGNVYYQKARIEAIVVEAALDGASYCADPLLRAIEESEDHSVPELGSVDIEPYRYAAGLFGGMSTIEENVVGLIKSRIGKLSTGLFAGMKPTGYDSVVVEYNSCFIASSVSVDMSYKIELPIRFIGQKENLALNFRTHTEVPVGDSPEFIRNVNLVEDLLEVTGVKENITDKINALKDKIDELFKKK